MRNGTRTALLLVVLSSCVAGRAGAQLPQLTFRPPDAFASRRSSDDDADADADGFLRFEYLCWWIKDAPLSVPLITSGSATGLGQIGAPGTTILAGDSKQSFGGLSGGRLHGLGWIDDEETYGFEAGGFFFEHHELHLQASAESSGNSVLGIPFINVTSGVPQASSIVLAQPGMSSGTATLYNGTQLYGFDFNFAMNMNDWLGDTPANLRLLAGLNVVSLNETLQLVTDSTSNAGASTHHSDIFNARNSFMGIQLGAVAGRRLGRAYFEVTPKVSVGGNMTYDFIAAQDTSPAIFGINAPRVIYNSHEGIFAQPSNIGRYWPTFFSVMPAIQARASYRLGPRCSLTMAYDGIFWTNVLRPGNMIDPQLNLTQATGNLRGVRQPVRSFNLTDFWAQGFSAGLQIAF